MLLKNTSQYNLDLVKFIVKFAAGLIDISNVAINIKNSQHRFAGRAFSQIPVESPWHKNTKARYLVVCRIGGPSLFPYQTLGYQGRKIENGRWPTPLFADWMEALVYLVAHELMHIQQFRSKARCSEQETEAFAMRRLLQWREEIVAAGKVPVAPTLKQTPVAPPKAKNAVLAAKLEHCRAMLATNMTKLKRAKTIVGKWEKKVRYYEKK